MMALTAVQHIGAGLDRPECVLATRRGDFFVSHRGHGVLRIGKGGDQKILSSPVNYGGLPLLPNGIALAKDGSFLIANIADPGGIFLLDAEGCRPFITNIDERPMPPVNFVTLDEYGRVWFSVSSTFSPRHLAYRRDIRNGFVGVVENGRARIVLEGLHYTNEIRPDLESGWLYVSETFGQHVSRFRLSENLEIGPREIFARFPRGAFPDGIALDAEGGLVVTCIVSNELFRVAPDGAVTCILSERVDDWVDTVEAALEAEQMDRSHFDRTPGRTLKNIASVAFCGEGLDQIVCGCLLGDSIVTIPAPVKGRPPVHWQVQCRL